MQTKHWRTYVLHLIRSTVEQGMPTGAGPACSTEHLIGWKDEYVHKSSKNSYQFSSQWTVKLRWDDLQQVFFKIHFIILVITLIVLKWQFWFHFKILTWQDLCYYWSETSPKLVLWGGKTWGDFAGHSMCSVMTSHRFDSHVNDVFRCTTCSHCTIRSCHCCYFSVAPCNQPVQTQVHWGSAFVCLCAGCWFLQHVI